MAQKTEYYEKLLAKEINWNSWKDVMNLIVARIKKKVDNNKRLIEAPDVYGVPQEIINLGMIFEEILWDMFYCECDEYEQVTIAHSPKKAYAVLAESEE